MIDLSKVPDEDLKREYMRRLNARRRRSGGRSLVNRPCQFCGKEFGAREMRVHIPQCKQEIMTNPKTALVGLTVTKENWEKIGRQGRR